LLFLSNTKADIMIVKDLYVSRREGNEAIPTGKTRRDKKGNEIIKKGYEYAEDFINGLALVKDDKFIYYINKTGKVIWKSQVKE
jgi:hypothetical protein